MRGIGSVTASYSAMPMFMFNLSYVDTVNDTGLASYFLLIGNGNITTSINIFLIKRVYKTQIGWVAHWNWRPIYKFVHVCHCQACLLFRNNIYSFLCQHMCIDLCFTYARSLHLLCNPEHQPQTTHKLLNTFIWSNLKPKSNFGFSVVIVFLKIILAYNY